jgi:hypothetical protein
MRDETVSGRVLSAKEQRTLLLEGRISTITKGSVGVDGHARNIRHHLERKREREREEGERTGTHIAQSQNELASQYMKM